MSRLDCCSLPVTAVVGATAQLLGMAAEDDAALKDTISSSSVEVEVSVVQRH